MVIVGEKYPSGEEEASGPPIPLYSPSWDGGGACFSRHITGDRGMVKAKIPPVYMETFPNTSALVYIYF